MKEAAGTLYTPGVTGVRAVLKRRFLANQAMQIVSVVNQKGGVAKTTTTANLGAGLALRGQRTLLIDLDPQANLTLGIGKEWDNLPYGLERTLVDPAAAPLTGLIRRVGELPLYLAPGSIALAQSESVLTQRGGSGYALRHALEDARRGNLFDWVLIDCPPSLGVLTQSAIVASTHLVVPTEPKMYAFAGMDTLNKLIVSLTKSYEFRVELLGVVLTLYERNTRLHRTMDRIIRERFGDKVFDTVIHKSVRISEAELEGEPLVLLDAKAASARSYLALTDEAIQRTSPAVARAF